MVVNKWKDLLERSGWTFIQAAVASLVVTGLSDWKTGLEIAAVAGLASVVKVLGAQQTGNGAGDLAPGGPTVSENS